jgi:uncharacterized CHY-type Zn-finger protein
MNNIKQEEGLDILKLVVGRFERANVYVSDSDVEEIRNSIERHLSRCYKCHSILPLDCPTVPMLFKIGDSLHALCPRCVELLVAERGHMVKCEGCGGMFHSLHTHHWFNLVEDDPPRYVCCTRKVCGFCNTRLQTRNLWKPHPYKSWMSHILPSWDLQLLYLSNSGEYETQREKLYPFPLPRLSEQSKSKVWGKR